MVHNIILSSHNLLSHSGWYPVEGTQSPFELHVSEVDCSNAYPGLQLTEQESPSYCSGQLFAAKNYINSYFYLATILVISVSHCFSR